MILLLAFAIHISGNLAEIIRGPVNGTYAAGSNILLTCIVRDDHDNIFWEDVGANKRIFIGRDKQTEQPKYTNFEISSVAGNYSLIIRNARTSDGGEYSCRNGDQNLNAVITVEDGPVVALFVNDTSNFSKDQYTLTVGETVVVTCRAKNCRRNVSLELSFGYKGWITPTTTMRRQNGSYFDVYVTHSHTVHRTDNPFLCRVLGLPRDLQAEKIVNILYIPLCNVIRSGNNVECVCEANPPVYEYTMFVNGEKKSVNKSLTFSDYITANYSCSAVNTIGTGYSSSRFISNASAIGIIAILCGMTVCCPLLVYLFMVRYRKIRRQRIPTNSYESSIRTSINPNVYEENSYHASASVINGEIDEPECIYATVYANTPKEKFVTFKDVQFEKHLGESGYLERWTGKLRSSKEVIVSSPQANLSPMAQLNWLAFVKSLLDLPKIAYIAHVEGICIEMGRFYLLQEYVQNGTLRQKLKSIMYKSIKRNEEVTSTSSVLLQLASSLIHGIEFIQHQNFYHPGLSSDEVIVFNETSCKLYDFCTADFIQDKIDDIIKKVEKGVETRTLPPEAVFKRVYDKASEMWSLAATLWEIFTHGQKAKFNYLKELSQQEPFEGECSLKKPHNLDNDIYKMMTKCWSKQPNCRPRICKLKHKIDGKIITSSSQREIGETPEGYELMTIGAKIE
ncbi:Fibroblast growth factor receptor 2 [Holothuria leucospilota]|uniref:Fibroblast growth factor receptor 2 n=1 Tax=Holothuria leucospilota TaxID=206669 RepID=A0A9Q1BXE0_HOLLE|nr:Fibroblast growth factor receptor 2 [Holothuria leucospilota]